MLKGHMSMMQAYTQVLPLAITITVHGETPEIGEDGTLSGGSLRGREISWSSRESQLHWTSESRCHFSKFLKPYSLKNIQTSKLGFRGVFSFPGTDSKTAWSVSLSLSSLPTLVKDKRYDRDRDKQTFDRVSVSGRQITRNGYPELNQPNLKTPVTAHDVN